MNSSINGKLFSYMEPEARQMFDRLVEAGMDPDLAFSVLELHLGESLFAIEDENDTE